MANFYIALEKILKHEGGYVNDPNDAGGETYKGISRNAHPKNYMWTIIDSYKEKYPSGSKSFKSALAKDKDISNYVNRIYKTSYWDKFKLDDVKYQSVAEQIFDDAVNRGVGAACKLCCALLKVPVVTTPSTKLLNALTNL